MNCTNYRKYSKYGICFSHHINYKKLENTICDKIRNLSAKYINEKEDFEKLLKNEYLDPKLEIQSKISNLRKEQNMLEQKQDTLYDDRFNGVISIETYQRLYSATENKIGNVKLKIRELEEQLSNLSSDNNVLLENKQIIEDFLNIKEPTREMLHKIVDKVYITKDKNIEIHYKVCNI